ncbi:hypothetical protein BB561_004563 [Smittium simulii]|uniref:pyridoxal kinase n=1 Tax=Smittium simulii TaxID=133385 RepID=A0A2T9YFI0_9FUNG|nr:hypothetical protein BB561_004563 [Smittium simulii]
MASRVLSIQSHVVAGYVGNRAATFPMQYAGLDVDVINTVQLSNHTGYQSIKGKVFEGSHITELFQGLQENKLDDYDFVLTGYMGKADNVNAVSQVVSELKKKNNDVFFLLDTVLGDYGELYVPIELVELYKTVLCPLANLVTPNQFEAETISGTKIKTLDDAVNVCSYFHDLGVKNVIITSTTLEDDNHDSMLHMIGSQISADSDSPKMFKISFPFLTGYFTGAGDLLCALILSRIAERPTKSTLFNENELKHICESALASQHLILTATADHQKKSGIPAPPGLNQSQMSSALVRSFELQLIPNRAHIVNPKIEFLATDI